MINLENIALLICVLLLLETVFELIFIFVDAASKVAVGAVGVAFNVLAIILFDTFCRPVVSSTVFWAAVIICIVSMIFSFINVIKGLTEDLAESPRF